MKFENVSAQTVKQWLDNDEAVLIDVREPAEFSTRHIEGATLIPVGKISVDDLPQTDKKVVIYCQKGARGNTACSKVTATEHGVSVYNLEGGIAAWQQANLHTVAGNSSVLPLDRQVQITIGSAVLAGSLSAYWLDPVYAFVPAFFGAGLLFAGLSGTCGLALLLAKMPWNQKTA